MNSTRQTTCAAPLGWSYNPAAWSQRLPVLVLALAGLGLSLYPAFTSHAQALPSVWHIVFANQLPAELFGRGMPPENTWNSGGYLLLAILSLAGSSRRWHTMPWLVLILGLASILVAALNMAQVVLQILLFSTWSLPVLGCALLSILLLGAVADEVLASLQHLKRTTFSRGYARGPLLRFKPSRHLDQEFRP